MIDVFRKPKVLAKIVFSSVVFSYSTTSSADEILIHTGDPGTSFTGAWHAATGASMPIDGNRGLYAIVGGEVETYRFTTTVPESNTYTLQVYNTCYTPRSTQVTQTLSYNASNEVFVTNQDCQTDPFVGRWRTLGTFDFQVNEQVDFELSTAGSNNSYVGISAIRYLFNETSNEPSPEDTPEDTPENTPPILSISSNSLYVDANTEFTLTANASDAEDGNLDASIQWTSPNLNTLGTSFTDNSGTNDFVVTVSVTDSDGAASEEDISINVQTTQAPNTTQIFNFGCKLGALSPIGLTSYNASALPSVGSMCNRYTAQLENNSANQTLFYHGDQGRLDGTIVNFPFEAILRNVGIAPVNQPFLAHQSSNNNAYNFIGLHIHHIDFNNINSAHLVVGQRGSVRNTIEGKKTLDGQSSVNDAGNNILLNGRADLRLVVDSHGHVTAFWQEPNLTGYSGNDDWIAYRSTGELPGTDPNWGAGNQVIVGIITYAYYSNGVPFWGVADQLEINEL